MGDVTGWFGPAPAWSPDGRGPAYLVGPATGSSGQRTLWLAQVDGGDRHPLAEGVAAFAWLP